MSVTVTSFRKHNEEVKIVVDKRAIVDGHTNTYGPWYVFAYANSLEEATNIILEDCESHAQILFLYRIMVQIRRYYYAG